MAGVLQHLRSSTLNKRPNPASMVDGQLAINYASGSPGAFFKDTSGNLVKVGPVHVGSTAPNVSPAGGGTAGNSLGEQWLDTSGGTYVFKIWDGGTWRSEAGEFVNTTGDTMTGALGIIAGSASTPGLFFSGDTNTGIWSPAADTIAFSEGGVEAMRIDSSGRLLVGTSAGTAKLDVFVTSNGDGLRLGYGNVPLGGIGPAISFAQYNNNSSMITTSSIQGVMTGGSVGAEAGDLIFNTSIGGATAAERMRITSAGNVGIGTSSPGEIVDVSSSSYPLIRCRTNGNTAAGLGVSTDNATNLWFIGARKDNVGGSTGTDRFNLLYGTNAYLTVMTAGNVGIGTTSPVTLLQVGTGNTGATTAKVVVNTNNVAGPGLIVSNWTGTGTTNGPRISFDNSTWGSFEIGGGNSTHSFIVRDTLAASDRFTIDSSGRLLVGTSSASGSEKMIVATSGTYGVAYQPAFKLLNTSSGGSTSSPTGLGAINWSTEGYDVANIEAVRTNPAGGTFSDLIFRTNGTNASTGAGTERMRINSNGYVKFANDGSPTNSSLSFSSFDQSINETGLYVNAKNASYTSSVLTGYAERAASSAYNLATFNSTHVPGVSTDIEFNLRGDGQAFADGSWTGGGADYAEYFEWSDSNPNGEDRRGISVVLDGDKIREASAGEDPIGVISGNPSVVGDAAWNKWHDKHLRDDFGTYIQEDYEVEDEDGNTIVQQRRKLNPAYDPDVEYISREQRPEWDCVGLMGKLRIRKGQITGSRWIKMRDISDSIEEWLVR